VQQVSALPVADGGNAERYQLTGLVICGLCGRRAEGHWAHGRARCRHGYTSSSDAQPGHLKTLYVRQDQIVEQAGAQLASLTGVDPAGLTAVELAAQLRVRGFAMVCTPVSITLDTGTDTVAVDNGDADPSANLLEDAARPADVGAQLTLFVVAPVASPALPRQRKTPTEVIRNANDFGGG